MWNLVSTNRVHWARNGVNGRLALPLAAVAPKRDPKSNVPLDHRRVRSKKAHKHVTQKLVQVGVLGQIGALAPKPVAVDKEQEHDRVQSQTDALVKQPTSIHSHAMPKDAMQPRLENRRNLNYEPQKRKCLR